MMKYGSRKGIDVKRFLNQRLLGWLLPGRLVIEEKYNNRYWGSMSVEGWVIRAEDG